MLELFSLNYTNMRTLTRDKPLKFHDSFVLNAVDLTCPICLLTQLGISIDCIENSLEDEWSILSESSRMYTHYKTVLVRVVIAMMKHHNQRNLGRKWLIWPPFPHHCSSMQMSLSASLLWAYKERWSWLTVPFPLQGWRLPGHSRLL